MRKLILASVLMLMTTGLARADESVAGDWRANLGPGVAMNMNVTPDGNWSSETYQNKEVVRQLKGTYTQKARNDHAGTMVFTPDEASSENASAKTETDRYELARNGSQLRLTANGDTMVFQKQTKH